ncbi:MAG: VacJ family lipoprotein [Lautropia sp.]|nr:VacJ family lipoprotein [Lautropia sp.]
MRRGQQEKAGSALHRPARLAALMTAAGILLVSAGCATVSSGGASAAKASGEASGGASLLEKARTAAQGVTDTGASTGMAGSVATAGAAGAAAPSAAGMQGAAAGSAAAGAAGAVTGAAGAVDGAAGAVGDAASALTGGLSDALPLGGGVADAVEASPLGVLGDLKMPTNPQDPLEPYNRVMQRFNDQADRYVAKPVAQAYDFLVPEPVQLVVANFFSNLQDVYTSVNNLLQAKPKAALNDITRFVVNTGFGFLGFADVASAIGMPKHQEDFGQTLGYWGVPSGPYFVLPIFGPSTIRDAAVRPLDGYGSYYAWVDNPALRNSLYLTEKVSDRAGLLEAEKLLDGAALDRYTLLRDGFLQRRRNQVYDGDPPEDDALDDPYADDPYADDPYAEEQAEKAAAEGADADSSAARAAP